MAETDAPAQPRELVQRLTSPPRLQGDVTQIQWLEAFFDLIFGIAITQMAALLDHHAGAGDVATFVLIFLPIWWVWMGNVVYGLRFSVDNLLYRFGSFVQILAVTALSILVPHIGTASEGFAIAYIVGRLVLLVLYAAAWRSVAQTRPAVRVYLTGFSIGVALWVVSLAVPAPQRFVLWGVGLAVDLATPWLGRPVLRRFPVNAQHLPQRMGIFVTIILGQSLFGVVEGVTNEQWQLAAALTAVAAFGLTVSIWWSYFSYYELAHPNSRLGSGQPYIYTHLPFILGVALISAALPRVIEQGGLAMPGHDVLWLLLGGLALWVIGFWAIQLVSVPPQHVWTVHILTVVALAFFGALAFVGQLIPIGITLAAVVVMQAAVIVVKLTWLQRVPPGRAGGQPIEDAA